MRTMNSRLRSRAPAAGGLSGVTGVVLTLAVGLTQAPVVLAHQGHGDVTLEKLTRNALAIVEGKVEAVSSAWNQARTKIYTTVRLRVSGYHKGGARANVIEVKFLGGTVGVETLAVLGQPAFAKDEEVFVFLRPNWETLDLPFVYMEHGKFTVQRDAARQTGMLRNSAGQAFVRSQAINKIKAVNAGTARADKP